MAFPVLLNRILNIGGRAFRAFRGSGGRGGRGRSGRPDVDIDLPNLFGGIDVIVNTPSPSQMRAYFDQIRAALGLSPRYPQFVGDLARIYGLLLADGFHRGVDPYGRPWKPSIRVGKCGGKTLIQSGRLRRSIRATPVGNRIRLSASAPYAETHQKGAVIRPRGVGPLKFQICGQWFTKKTVTIPARPILPDRGLPRAWEAAAQDLLNRRSNRVRGIHVRP